MKRERSLRHRADHDQPPTRRRIISWLAAPRPVSRSRPSHPVACARRSLHFTRRHGTVLHPYAFARLKVLELGEAHVIVRVAKRIARPFVIEVHARFDSPELGRTAHRARAHRHHRSVARSIDTPGFSFVLPLARALHRHPAIDAWMTQRSRPFLHADPQDMMRSCRALKNSACEFSGCR